MTKSPQIVQDQTGRTEVAAPWTDWLRRARAAHAFGEFASLAREARALREQHGDAAGHVPLRVALLGGGDAQLLFGPLEVTLIAAGLAPVVQGAPFDRIVPELINPESETSRFEPQIVLVANTTFNIPTWPEPDATRERAECVRRLLIIYPYVRNTDRRTGR